MEIKYWVNCFDRELTVILSDEYIGQEQKILDMLEEYYLEWHAVEEIEDPERQAYVNQSCCEEYMIERLSETYQVIEWDSDDEDEDEEEDERMYRVQHMENIFEIGRSIQALIDCGEIEVEDSKSAFAFALKQAIDFEFEYDGYGDYYGELDKFVIDKIKDEFGVEV